jgi:hypothetical protein
MPVKLTAVRPEKKNDAMRSSAIFVHDKGAGLISNTTGGVHFVGHYLGDEVTQTIRSVT